MAVQRHRPRQVQARLVRLDRRLRLQAQEGPERGRRPRDLAPEGRAGVDDEVPAQRAEAVRAQADARLVRQEHAEHRLRRHLLLHEADPEGQVTDWDMLPEAMKATYEKLGIPEAERKFLAGVTAQYESEVVYHKNREDLERLGVLFTEHGPGGQATTPRSCSEHLGTVIPPGDNKFAALELRGVERRLVHLRAARRARRHAAAGVLPHQRGERRAVRAHADHRRRGRVGALRRGLLGAGVLAPTRCTRRSSSSSRSPVRASGTRRSRTGRRTSTTSSPSERAPRPSRPSSGSTATSARSSR